MDKLINKTKNVELASEVILAKSLSQRMIGLMFQPDLPVGKALWIQKCHWIHTFFMKFPIDVLFVDKHLVVQKTVTNIPPWRLPGPSLRSTSVFEFSAGQIQNQHVEVGDQLYVGH